MKASSICWAQNRTQTTCYKQFEKKKLMKKKNNYKNHISRKCLICNGVSNFKLFYDNMHKNILFLSKEPVYKQGSFSDIKHIQNLSVFYRYLPFYEVLLLWLRSPSRHASEFTIFKNSRQIFRLPNREHALQTNVRTQYIKFHLP